MTQPMLCVSDLHVHYGGIQAVKGVSFEVFAGELVSLIGSNGAGKTTTMKAITGLLSASAGSIELNAKPIHKCKPWDLVKLGLAMVPEGRGVFTRMTIIENLQMGAYIRNDGADIDEDMERIFTTFPRLKERSHQLAGTLSGGEQQMLAMGRALMSRVFTRMTIIENLQMGAYSRNDGADIDEDMERIFTTFPRLKERSHQLAGTLSGGEQQMLAMGRALMSRPSLLLLDEPSMGLSPLMVDKIFEVIQSVATQGVTIVLVEQNASRALQIAQRAYVMESGVITLSGKAGDLLHDSKVRAAYLGE